MRHNRDLGTATVTAFAGATAIAEAAVFKSFIQAGFECSTHRLKCGKRLDVISSTAHDVLVRADYQRLIDAGIKTVREGLRWHLIQDGFGRFDLSSIIPTLDAADEFGIEQIIDLFHFGWPESIDIFAPEFVHAFSDLAMEFALLLRARGVLSPFIAPMNEISFMSWAGGDRGFLNPFQEGRGMELKQQLVRAGIAASKAFLEVLSETRLVWPEPVIHIAGDAMKAGDEDEAEAYRLSMYEVWDMLSGLTYPELGGQPNIVQFIGVNFYDRNEWLNHGETLSRSDSLYKPFHAILLEIWNRYRVPLLISETGSEDDERPDWFAYISQEVRRAVKMGVPVHGICLYPILNHPGWDDDRHCHNGLFDYADSDGNREVYQPLAVEMALQQKLNSAVYLS